MANSKIKKLSLIQMEYQTLARAKEPPRKLVRNCLRAFVIGGCICLLGEALMQMFIHWFNFTEKTAGNPTTAVLIFISVVMTSSGVYDKFAQWAGAGTSVPVTGFANAVCSAALEHKSEGFVIGVGGNMFKLAGSVIVFGVVAAFIVGLIHLIVMGGH